MKHLAQIQSEFIRIAKDDLNGEVHEEREKRLELKSLPKECKDVKPTIIKQGILHEVKKGKDIIAYARIRMKKEHNKDPQFSLGVKHFPLAQEAETEISKQMFNAFYPDNLKKPQSKKRYTLKNGWDVDDVKDGPVLAEYEHGKGEKIDIPEHWEVKKEKN